jgi:hypothetical protein
MDNTRAIVNYRGSLSNDNAIIPHDNLNIVEYYYIPDSFRGTEPDRSCFYQVMQHNIFNINNNKALQNPNEVFIKDCNIPADFWNDIHILKILNSSSVWDSQILSFKQALASVEKDQLVSYFHPLGTASKEITISILQAMHLYGEPEDRVNFIRLLQPFLSGNYDPTHDHVCQLYNIISYSIPYIFLLCHNDPNLQIFVVNTPYEFCAQQLQNLLKCSLPYDLSYNMRFQAYLEGALPSFTTLRFFASTLSLIYSRSVFLYSNKTRILQLLLLNTSNSLVFPILSNALDAFDIVPFGNTTLSPLPTSRVSDRGITFSEITLFTWNL